MQLKIEQLETSPKLHAAYLLAGDEPFQKLTALDLLRQRARAAGFDERQVFDFSDGKSNWDGLLQACQSLGLFSQRQIIELNLGEKRPDKSGNESLKTVLQLAGDDLLLLISCSQISSKKDEKTDWYQACDKAGAIVKIWPVGHQELPGRAHRMLQKVGLDADADALQLLATRSEGNLLALSQEIEKLALLYPATQLTPTHIQDSVADSSHFTLFDLSAAASVNGGAERALRILDHLREEGEAPSLILWHLSRDLGAMEALSLGQASGVFLPRPRLAELERQARRLGNARLQQLLKLAFACDTRIKGQAHGNAWDSLASLVLAMTGAPLPLSPAPAH